jgi:hypothetical protein
MISQNMIKKNIFPKIYERKKLWVSKEKLHINYNGNHKEFELSILKKIKLVKVKSKRYELFTFFSNTIFLLSYIFNFNYTILFLHALIYIFSYFYFIQYKYYFAIFDNTKWCFIEIKSSDKRIFRCLIKDLSTKYHETDLLNENLNYGKFTESYI